VVVNHATTSRGRRERESVCVCMYERLHTSHLTMGVRARFVIGIILEAAGMQTECGGKEHYIQFSQLWARR